MACNRPSSMRERFSKSQRLFGHCRSDSNDRADARRKVCTTESGIGEFEDEHTGGYKKISTKNLFWDELNVLKQKLFVKSKKTIEVYR